MISLACGDVTSVARHESDGAERSVRRWLLLHERRRSAEPDDAERRPVSHGNGAPHHRPHVSQGLLLSGRRQRARRLPCWHLSGKDVRDCDAIVTRGLQDLETQSNCKTCPAGHYCLANTTDFSPNIGPSGHYFPGKISMRYDGFLLF